MLFVRNDIPSKMISIEKLLTESFLFELNLRKKKWVFNCSYYPNNGNIELRYLNALFVTIFQHFLKTFFQSLNVVSVRAIAPKIVCL